MLGSSSGDLFEPPAILDVVQAVPRSHLQLTAVACKMIAAKMEQETHPSVHDFTNIADHCFQVLPPAGRLPTISTEWHRAGQGTWWIKANTCLKSWNLLPTP